MASLLNYTAPTRDLTAPDAIEQLLTAAIAKRQPTAWNINDLGRARDERGARTAQLMEAITGSNTMRDNMNARQLEQESIIKAAEMIAKTGDTENPSAPDMSNNAALMLMALTGQRDIVPMMSQILGPSSQRVVGQRGIKESTEAYKRVGEGTDSFDRAGVRLDDPKITNFLEILQRAMSQGLSRDERRQLLDNQGQGNRVFGKTTQRGIITLPDGRTVEETNVYPRGQSPAGRAAPFPAGPDRNSLPTRWSRRGWEVETAPGVWEKKDQ